VVAGDHVAPHMAAIKVPNMIAHFHFWSDASVRNPVEERNATGTLANAPERANLRIENLADRNRRARNP
jgi:hypothetical protein